MINAERVPLFVALSFCAGLFTVAGALIGVALAYAKRGEVAGTWGESILTYFITTFWVGLAVGLIGWLLTLIWIGWVVLGSCTSGMRCAACAPPWPPSTSARFPIRTAC